MKTKHTALKSSSIGASTAVLLAASAQINVAGVSLPIWAGQFKQAYSSTSSHTSSSMIVRSGTNPSLKDHLIWAAQFKEAYAPSSPKTHVATAPGLTAWPNICSGQGNFKEAYQPVREEAVETIGATQLAMNQKWGTASAGLCRLLASTGRSQSQVILEATHAHTTLL